MCFRCEVEPSQAYNRSTVHVDSQIPNIRKTRAVWIHCHALSHWNMTLPQAWLNKDFWKTPAPNNWLKVSLQTMRKEDRLTSIFDLSLLKPSYTQGNMRDRGSWILRNLSGYLSSAAHLTSDSSPGWEPVPRGSYTLTALDKVIFQGSFPDQI